MSSLLGQLYSDSQDVSAQVRMTPLLPLRLTITLYVQVLLLVLYSALRQGQEDKARRIVRDRCPTVSISQSASAEI